MSEIPAGWYPDPQDTTSEPRPERWWDGTGWTAGTRPGAAGTGAADGAGTAESGASGDEPTVIEGQVVGSGPSVRYPEYPPFASEAPPKAARRPSRPVVAAAAVAAVAGLAVGSGVTYLAMDGRGDSASARPFGDRGYPFGGQGRGQGPGNGGGNGDAFGGPGGGFGLGGGNGNGGGNGSGKGSGNGGGLGGNGGTATSGVAVDAVNGISLPILSGWQGTTTARGYAALSIGSYTCADGSGTCSLGGATTGSLDGSDAKQAALSDIAAAAKESYGDIKGHQEVKSEAVTVAGRSGYLVRWKVDAPQGNDGYVETVVFPGAARSGGLVAVHLGFDIADKAPALSVMDAIVKGIAPATGGQGGTTT